MRSTLVILVSLLLISPAWATSWKTQIPNAQKVGESRLTYLFWEVYDATLYAPKGKWSASKPFALKLHYLRNLEGEKIADRSAEEMRKQGFSDEVKLAAWYSQMKEIFPDVKKGTEITGIYKLNAPTQFLLDGKPLGEIKDPDFGKHFFDIWLSEKTTEPAMREELLGLNDL